MKKDAYYFPHFSNARHDRKLRRVRKELGVEGYGIYFMLLETLRDQELFRYPIEDLDLLADEFGTSEQKIRTVICNYDLFQVIDLDGKESFVSMKFVEYLQPYLDNKHRNRINGIKGNLIKYGYITKVIAENLTDAEILELDEQRKNMLLLPSGGDSGGEQPSDRKESKVNKSKVNKNKIEEIEKINNMRMKFPGTKTKADALKKIPSILKEHDIEELERCIDRYTKDVAEKRKSQPGLSYLNESTFWNGRYVDYLDENYTEIKAQSNPLAYKQPVTYIDDGED